MEFSKSGVAPLAGFGQLADQPQIAALSIVELSHNASELQKCALTRLQAVLDDYNDHQDPDKVNSQSLWDKNVEDYADVKRNGQGLALCDEMVRCYFPQLFPRIDSWQVFIENAARAEEILDQNTDNFANIFGKNFNDELRQIALKLHKVTFDAQNQGSYEPSNVVRNIGSIFEKFVVAWQKVRPEDNLASRPLSEFDADKLNSSLPLVMDLSRDYVAVFTSFEKKLNLILSEHKPEEREACLWAATWLCPEVSAQWQVLQIKAYRREPELGSLNPPEALNPMGRHILALVANKSSGVLRALESLDEKLHRPSRAMEANQNRSLVRIKQEIETLEKELAKSLREFQESEKFINEYQSFLAKVNISIETVFKDSPEEIGLSEDPLQADSDEDLEEAERGSDADGASGSASVEENFGSEEAPKVSPYREPELVRRTLQHQTVKRTITENLTPGFQNLQKIVEEYDISKQEKDLRLKALRKEEADLSKLLKSVDYKWAKKGNVVDQNHFKHLQTLKDDPDLVVKISNEYIQFAEFRKNLLPRGYWDTWATWRDALVGY